MRDYEIRYLHDDGTLSLSLYKTACQDDEGAQRVAQQMLPGDCAGFEIWSDGERIGGEAGRLSAA